MTEAEFHKESPAPDRPETPAPEAPPPEKPAPEMPGTAVLEAAVNRSRRRRRRGRIGGGILCGALLIAAAGALVCAKWFPLFRISGNSMAPALDGGQIVAASTAGGVQKGDIIAFYNGGGILVKRVIAWAGDWVDIDGSGTVYVNSFALEEPYVSEAALGRCDMEFPCRVPEGCVFVLGDRRSVSVDSRSGKVGFVDQERIIGRITYRVWPLDSAGELEARK